MTFYVAFLSGMNVVMGIVYAPSGVSAVSFGVAAFCGVMAIVLEIRELRS